MWSNYTKTYVFRDCFNQDVVSDNVTAINKLLAANQFNNRNGAFITTDLVGIDIADRLEAYQTEDILSWVLDFYNGDRQICSISIDDYKEIQFQFEIEENIETSEFTIHYCTVKGLKEYQI